LLKAWIYIEFTNTQNSGITVIKKINIKLNSDKGEVKVKVTPDNEPTFKFTYNISSDNITNAELERCLAIVEILCKDK